MYGSTAFLFTNNDTEKMGRNSIYKPPKPKENKHNLKINLTSSMSVLYAGNFQTQT